jgi:quinol monooxygenase YgiN
MLIFTAKLTVKADSAEEFERTMRGVVPQVREEADNHAYVFYRSTEDPRQFMFYEEYTDEAALGTHRAHLKEMGVDLRSMLDGSPTLEFYERLI